MQSTNKKQYDEPMLEIIAFDSQDVITTSGGFMGDWDMNMPQDIDHPQIGF